MRVEVRYFAAAREAAGRDGETVEIGAGSTLEALTALLLERHSRLAPMADGLRFAVGESFCELDTVLAEGDLVALIPPVSGG